MDASPFLSSTFGWVRMRHDAEVAFPSLEAKRGAAPLLAIAASHPEDFVAALSQQSMQDYRLVGGMSEESGDFGCFRKIPAARYYMVITSGHLAARLIDQPGLLAKVVFTLLRYDLALARLTDGACLAIVVSRRHLGETPDIPVRRGPSWIGLHEHVRDLGQVADLDVNDLRPRRLEWYTLEGGGGSGSKGGYRLGPYVVPSTPADREMVDRLLDATPYLPGSPLWTCLSNEWYGHRRILTEFCWPGGPDLQLRGKLQHGWQSGPGIDGEQGFRQECALAGYPVWLWSARNLCAARTSGLPQAEAIGAPALYLEAQEDPGPARNWLLAMPYHSVPEYPIAAGFAAYVDDVLSWSKAEGFEGVTFCLHHVDWDNLETRQAVMSRAPCITLGQPFQLHFLARLRALIRAHAAVTSDRVCTAGFYAGLWGRPFVVHGHPLASDPPDPDVGLGADPRWIEAEMPALLKLGEVQRDMALKELGADFLRAPRVLYEMLYGWMDRR